DGAVLGKGEDAPPLMAGETAGPGEGGEPLRQGRVFEPRHLQPERQPETAVAGAAGDVEMQRFGRAGQMEPEEAAFRPQLWPKPGRQGGGKVGPETLPKAAVAGKGQRG